MKRTKMTVELVTDKPHRVKVMVGLLGINILCFLGIALVIILMTLLPILSLESPPPEAQFYLNITWLFIVSTPLVFVGSLAGAWINFGFGHYGRAFIFAPLPFINIVAAPYFLNATGL